MSDFPNVIELNVGGVVYTTTLGTLTRDSGSLLYQMFTGKIKDQPIKDSKGKYFLDRDGVLFRYVLDYLRNQKMILPETFQETERLKQEADHYRLPGMVRCLAESSSSSSAAGSLRSPTGVQLVGGRRSSSNNPGAAAVVDQDSQFLGSPPDASSSSSKETGYIVVGYRGTFAFGRDGLADVKFRKLARILVSGRVSICREVFQDTLNESRDPDRGTSDRYSARFFLKHAFIEQAFDMLQDAGFRMVGSCGSGTNSAGEAKPGMDSEENKWNHYNEFVFCRP